MLTLRNLALLALSVTGAIAQTSTTKTVCDSDFEVESDGDIAQLGSCKTLKGSLTLGEKVTSITLPSGLTAIEKDFVCKSAANLRSISAPALTKIGGDFQLRELTVLSTLSMPFLSSVKNINFITLPNLRQLDFGATVTSAENVYISDTLLQSLTGLNLTSVNIFDVSNNKYLKTVDLSLSKVSESLNINFNAKGVEASFPNLLWAMNVSLGDAGKISFPKLSKVNSSISFINNTFTDAAFPALKEVGESLAFVSCTELTNLTMLSLETVGGTFMLANNTKLEEVKGFPKLKSVGGAVDLSGVFSTVELGALEDVRGTFNLQSTGEIDCTGFNKLKSDGVVQGGKLTCKSGLEEAESQQGGASTKGGKKGGNGGDSDKESGAASVATNMVLAVVAGAAVMMAL